MQDRLVNETAGRLLIKLIAIKLIAMDKLNVPLSLMLKFYFAAAVLIVRTSRVPLMWAASAISNMATPAVQTPLHPRCCQPNAPSAAPREPPRK